MMKLIIRLATGLFLLALLLIISCRKNDYSCEGCSGNNKAPLANAGSDQIITLPKDSIALNGSSSRDEDGTIVNYKWAKIDGPGSYFFNDVSLVKPLVKQLKGGTYLFELTVTDNGGLSAKDTARVIVDSIFIPNHAPVAIAGPDQTIVLPTNSVNLNGNGSSDPDNNISSYVWSKISGPVAGGIASPNFIQAVATNLGQGTYQFELRVTDAGGLFSSDTMQVVVSPQPSLAPVARAGNDTIINNNQASCSAIPISITLNGSTSYDPDGTIVSYQWTGTGQISNPTAAITTVGGLMPGAAWFYLRVTDNTGVIGYDTIKITIIPANRPLVPAQLIPIGTLSQPRGSVTMGAAGNKILFAGGTGIASANCSSTRVDIYDISSNSWTTAELSQPRYNMGVAILGNKIFFAGGFNPGRFANSTACYISNGTQTRSSAIDVYDAANNTWSTAQLSTPRVPKGAAAGNNVVFAGGDCMYMSIVSSNVFDLYDGGSNAWTTGLLSESKGLPQVATTGTKIYLAGGASQLNGDDWSGISNRIDIYNTSSGTWSVEFLSRERAEMASICTNSKMYWAGGYVISADPTIGYEATNLVEIRDLNSGLTSFDCLSEPKASLTAVKKGNKILFLDGYSQRFDIYDLTTQSWSIGVLDRELYGATFLSVNDIIYVVGSTSSGVLNNLVWKLQF